MSDDFEDHGTSNLPPEAFIRDEPLEINYSWLGKAAREEQLDAMRAWWFYHYEDPSLSTSYSGREGGFLYVHGGPFDPADELPAHFSRVVGEEVVQELVDELHAEVGHEWAPVQRYEDEFDVEPHERNEPVLHLIWSLAETDKLMELVEQQRDAQDILLRHAFISLIAALETYLWETTKYWVTTDQEVLRNIVTKSPKFRELPLKLGQIFERHEHLLEEVNDYLRNMVWHRLGEVKSLMQVGMGINMPSIAPLLDKVVVRHDLVHRNGRSSAGKLICLTRAHVERLKRLVLEFCVEVEVALARKWPALTSDFAEQSLRTALSNMAPAGSAEPPPEPPDDF